MSEVLRPLYSIPRIRIVLFDKSAALVQAWKRNIDDFNKNPKGYNTKRDLQWFGVPVELVIIEGSYNEVSEEVGLYNNFHPNESIMDIRLNTEKGVTTVVSPGNSLGYFGGGVDRAIADIFRFKSKKTSQINSWKDTERFVQSKLLDRYNGYLTPGHGNLIEFEDEDFYKSSDAWRKLRANSILHLPTMRVPRPLVHPKYSSETYQEGNDSNHKEIETYYHRLDLRKWHSFIFDATWEILSKVTEANSKSLKWLDYRHSIIDTVIIPGIGTGYGGLPEELVAKCMIAAITIFTNSKLQSLEKSIYSLRFLNEDFGKLVKDDELEKVFASNRRPASAKTLPVPGDGKYDSLYDSLDFLYT